MKTLEQTVQYFEYKLQSAQADIEKLCASLQENPAYALEWAQDQFTQAAWVKLAKWALNGAKEADEGYPELLVNHLQKQALYAARYPHRSTSATANLMKQAEAAVYAEAAEYLSDM